MSADDIFGILLLFISILGALFFMISHIKKGFFVVKEKTTSQKHSKI